MTREEALRRLKRIQKTLTVLDEEYGGEDYVIGLLRDFVEDTRRLLKGGEDVDERMREIIELLDRKAMYEVLLYFRDILNEIGFQDVEEFRDIERAIEKRKVEDSEIFKLLGMDMF